MSYEHHRSKSLLPNKRRIHTKWIILTAITLSFDNVFNNIIFYFLFPEKKVQAAVIKAAAVV